jgi:hypothetical protein
MTDRSNLATVRNPVLALPGFSALRNLPLPVRQALADAFKDLAADARQRADKCWKSHKAPMAAYWKAVSVYANHIKRAVQP